MIKQVYSFHDSKVCVYHPPMVLLNDGEARRLASDCVNDAQTPMSRHPADFRLVRLGEYDDNSGTLIPLSAPEFVCDLVEFKPKEV
jgi:hypothetical protein